MAKDDYSSTGGGLKLKGAKPTGIEKKRKKKPKTEPTTQPHAPSSTTPSRAHDDADPVGTPNSHTEVGAYEGRKAGKELELELRQDQLHEVQKTEAERRHEEMRRKRLNERLQREGLKTHKERVEELNKYLSGLSEHHDMPRIGPG